MKAFLSPLLLSLLATTLGTACAVREPDTPSAPSAPDILPLRSLRLYETGVGYFERSGTMGSRAITSLPVPPGHLDDALASLVILRSSGDKAVSGLAFTSSVTRATARARAGLPADPTSPIAFRDLLTSMKGEKVTVTTLGATEPTVGRVVEVNMELDEVRQRALTEIKDAKHDEPPNHLVVTLLGDDGAVAMVPAEQIVRIRPTDPAFASRLDAALDALGTRSAQNARALKLLGDAKGQVTFGYVAETPIWRASYRLIQGQGAPGQPAITVLQGWALLHNDTDESWRDVHLELVNGEPDSFVFPMAAPRYARRELVHPDNPLSTMPQLQDTTADALWGDHLDETGVGEGGGGYGFGSGHGRLGGSHRTVAPSLRMGQTMVDGRTTGSSLLDVGNLADLAPAAGVEQGALFVYTLPGGFSLDAHSSALVPFVQRTVSAESIAFFNGAGEPGRAAIVFVNSTGQTLPTGTVSVFGGGGFTGETSLDRLKPGERRFLQIGSDLDAEVTADKSQSHDEAKRLSIVGEALAEHFLRTTTTTWKLENRGGATKTFYVRISADQNAKVSGADRVDFDDATGRPVVVFMVKPKEKAARSFTVVEGLERQFGIDLLTEKNARALLLHSTIPASDLSILHDALPRIAALEAAHAEVHAAEHAAEVAEQDLEHLREDLKALGGGSAAGGGGVAAAPLVKKMVDAEDRVGLARKAKEVADKKVEAAREAAKEALKALAPKTTE
jgi:hypothetical protein